MAELPLFWRASKQQKTGFTTSQLSVFVIELVFELVTVSAQEVEFSTFGAVLDLADIDPKSVFLEEIGCDFSIVFISVETSISSKNRFRTIEKLQFEWIQNQFCPICVLN